MCIILIGSARRGASGALYLQSTTVELNAHLRGELVLQVGWVLVMTPRSCAMVNHEPCQGLTTAALSESNCVPQGNFDRAMSNQG